MNVYINMCTYTNVDINVELLGANWAEVFKLLYFSIPISTLS